MLCDPDSSAGNRTRGNGAQTTDGVRRVGTCARPAGALHACARGPGGQVTLACGLSAGEPKVPNAEAATTASGPRSGPAAVHTGGATWALLIDPCARPNPLLCHVSPGARHCTHASEIQLPIRCVVAYQFSIMLLPAEQRAPTRAHCADRRARFHTRTHIIASIQDIRRLAARNASQNCCQRCAGHTAQPKQPPKQPQRACASKSLCRRHSSCATLPAGQRS